MFQSIWQDILLHYRSGDNRVRLIFVMVAIFLTTLVMKIITTGTNFYQSYLDFFSFSPNITEHWMIWRWITYGFLHKDFWHLLFNCLYLWWFGSIFTTFNNNKNLLKLFFFGVFLGALGYFIVCNVFDQFLPSTNTYRHSFSIDGTLIGASAGVMSILWASVTYSPNYELFLFGRFRVPLKYLALFFFVIDIVSISRYANTGGAVAHIFGALAGFLFVRYASSVKMAFTDKKKKTHLTVEKSIFKQSEKTDIEKNLNSILEKIKIHGFDSLSPTEKNFLDQMKDKL